MKKNKTLKKINFKNCTLDSVEDTFGVKQVFQMTELDTFLSFPYKSTLIETEMILKTQNFFLLGGDDWNEVELENKFISPLILLSQTANEKFSYFLERELSVKIDEYIISGKVDGMIASGFRNPKKPFFCLNEYKKGTDPNGDPKGQVLIAMIAAQVLNNNYSRVYGCFVIGKHWHFMILQEKQYIISKSFHIEDKEIFDVFRILKGLYFEIERITSSI